LSLVFHSNRQQLCLVLTYSRVSQQQVVACCFRLLKKTRLPVSLAQGNFFTALDH